MPHREPPTPARGVWHLLGSVGLALIGSLCVACAVPAQSETVPSQATVEALNAQVSSLQQRLATLEPETATPRPTAARIPATATPQTAEPVMATAVEPTEEPMPEPTGTAPPTFTLRPTPFPTRTPRVITEADAVPCALGQVKGNRNSRIYHVPGGGSYSQTKTNVQCFDSEAEAEAAGYRRARN